MKEKISVALIACNLISSPALADDSKDSGVLSYITDNLSQTWNADNYELYIPINTWHNRNYYSAEKINQYNEHPWGLGVGKYRLDDDGDWHSLYIMAFSDSHKDLEPVAGYGFQKMWHPSENWRLGAGYTLGFTVRKDFNYLPIPVVAPLFSVEYKQLAIQSTYIVGGEGNGNILFTWLRWQLDQNQTLPAN